MTFEKIMEIFKEQFEIDKDIEAVKFRRGYQIFIWDDKQHDYIPNAELIPTLDELFEKLLDETRAFYEMKYRDSETEMIDDEHCKIIDDIIENLKSKYASE